MKKFLVFLSILLFPFNVYAYSDKVILGGDTIGIDIKTKGVLVIGFYKVNGLYPKGELKEGDMIVEVGDKAISSIQDLTQEIEENISVNDEVEITFLRGDKKLKTNLKLIKIEGVYKTGLYVKDKITGIGTLTFIDPESNTYGALGHEIVEGNTLKMIEVEEGEIFENSITSIDKSEDGSPGSKNARFYYQNVFGDIKKNTKYGIYGRYESEEEDKLIEIASKDEVKIGEASIYTVIEGEEVEEFQIYIDNINENTEIKNISFEVVDERLLAKTGGIVQGMSGSPIVQNGKLIGAVTHVVSDNVKRGYGIFITTMLRESELPR